MSRGEGSRCGSLAYECPLLQLLCPTFLGYRHRLGFPSQGSAPLLAVRVTLAPPQIQWHLPRWLLARDPERPMRSWKIFRRSKVWPYACCPEPAVPRLEVNARFLRCAQRFPTASGRTFLRGSFVCAASYATSRRAVGMIGTRRSSARCALELIRCMHCVDPHLSGLS